MKIAPVLAVVLSGLAFAPAAVTADQVDQVNQRELGRKLCMADVFSVCAQYIPDPERIAVCLISNRDRISQPCRLLLTNGVVSH